MRVALLSRAAHPLHEPGGMERAVYEQARQLGRRGVEVVLLTRPATREGAFPGEVVTVDYGPARGHGRVLDRTLRYPRFAERLGEKVAELVRAGRVDLVDAQGLTALGYGRLRRRDPSLRAPLVMNPQGMEEHHARGAKRLALARLRALSREAASLADRVIATDEATRADVPRLLGVDPARVAVVPNAIDPEAVRAATPPDPAAFVRAALPALRDAAPLFLSVGRLERYKGFGDVRQAFRCAQARGALPAGWAWAVVGEGPERLRLQRRADDHVHLLGRVDDPLLHALYARADVFVHAPRYEGSSLVTLEAMAHGLPVIATRAGGLPDKVIEGRTGHLVDPGDIAALSGAITKLAASDGRRALGRRGADLVQERFAWPVVVERWLALYEELLRTR
jgi:glycogen(starch) synthase